MPVLSWEGRGRRVVTPYHALVCESLVGNTNHLYNILLQGDNLAGLKSLLPHFAGKVKCVFIDPPYNTGNAFQHYDDNLQHSQWLDLIYPRLVLLRDLLAQNGSIWITIDDDEAHYLKVIMDEIFGRKNFVANVVWQKKFSPQNDAKWLSDSHDHILVYAQEKEKWRPYLLSRTEIANARYKNPDNDPRGVWTSADISVKTYNPEYDYPITTPSGKIVNPSSGRCWMTSKNSFAKLVTQNRIWFGENGNNIPREKKFLTEVKEGVTSMTVWLHSEVSNNQTAKKETKAFNSDEVFSTPKPEKLIQRILHLATKPGDIVLDSFLGSGTTAAVAHKMRRRWIGIEMGEHAKTHCIPRLKQVIDGEQGGISKTEQWSGGGGFYFMLLGEPIFDDAGNVNPTLDFAALAAHIWFYETQTPLSKRQTQKTFLGVHQGIGYALLYNGIIKDKSAQGGNALTNATLKIIRAAAPKNFSDKIVVYGNSVRLQPARLQNEKLEFRQIPFALKQEEQ